MGNTDTKAAEFGIASAGLSGAVISRKLAPSGFGVEVIASIDPIGSNRHFSCDTQAAVITRQYGLRISPAPDQAAPAYAKRLAEFQPFSNRVNAVANIGSYSLAPNPHTITQVFGTVPHPDASKPRLESKSDSLFYTQRTFSEQEARIVHHELYEASFLGHTQLKWELHRTELPAETLERLLIHLRYEALNGANVFYKN
jgi:UDP-galactopyranose mutase